MGKESIYSKIWVSLSPEIDLTVVISINIGKITIVTWIYIRRSLLNPLNPITWDWVTPAIKNKAIIPPKTRE